MKKFYFDSFDELFSFENEFNWRFFPSNFYQFDDILREVYRDVYFQDYQFNDLFHGEIVVNSIYLPNFFWRKIMIILTKFFKTSYFLLERVGQTPWVALTKRPRRGKAPAEEALNGDHEELVAYDNRY